MYHVLFFNKQQLTVFTAFTDWFLKKKYIAFPVRYGMGHL